ncbi:mavicyanin-like [Prunus avium]|uniref:Mavicyanin-like n=1 Tax=Prunus avium TaxID=42229 RepID=A0A6P5S2P5_PRUAV|nr:mavicyanin-like [Prunus avium]
MVKSSMNNGKVMVFSVAVAAAASMVLQTTEAAEYIVGDDLGWTVPPNGAATYVEWASKYNFIVNDILDFKFAQGEQDVTLVTKENFEICNSTDPLFQLQKPARFQFLSADTFYFICSFAGHCAQGQKVAVTFAPSASPSPSPCPSSADAPPAASLPLKFVLSRKVGFRKV